MTTPATNLRKWEIEVRALGYETFTATVHARTFAEAKTHKPSACINWCKTNNVSRSELGLAFVTIRMVR